MQALFRCLQAFSSPEGKCCLAHDYCDMQPLLGDIDVSQDSQATMITMTSQISGKHVKIWFVKEVTSPIDLIMMGVEISAPHLQYHSNYLFSIYLYLYVYIYIHYVCVHNCSIYVYVFLLHHLYVFETRILLHHGDRDSWKQFQILPRLTVLQVSSWTQWLGTTENARCLGMALILNQPFF